MVLRGMGSQIKQNNAEQNGVEGLKDEHTSKKVGHALQEVWGIVSVDDFHLPRNEVTFTYDDKAAELRDFRESLKEPIRYERGQPG